MTTTPVTARDDIAKVLARTHFVVHRTDWDGDPCGEHLTIDEVAANHLTDALLASPVFARLLDEARAEGWDEGSVNGRQDGYYGETSPNPYRKDTP